MNKKLVYLLLVVILMSMMLIVGFADELDDAEDKINTLIDRVAEFFQGISMGAAVVVLIKLTLQKIAASHNNADFEGLSKSQIRVLIAAGSIWLISSVVRFIESGMN